MLRENGEEGYCSWLTDTACTYVAGEWGGGELGGDEIAEIGGW